MHPTPVTPTVYPSETYNFDTRLLEDAARPELHSIIGDVAYDAASCLVPIEPDTAPSLDRPGFACYISTTTGTPILIATGV